MIDFERGSGWYKNSFGESVAESVAESVGESVGGFFRGLSLPGRPAHILTYPWPAKIPCQLRSPKDIINPKIITLVSFGKKRTFGEEREDAQISAPARAP